jgi:hypothetical protein
METLGPFIVLAVLLLPPLLVSVLKRTPLYWLPGAGLVVLALIIWGTTGEVHSGHEENPLAGVGEFIALVAAAALSMYGLICIVVAARMHARALRETTSPQPPTVEPPPATVVNDLPLRGKLDADS